MDEQDALVPTFIPPLITILMHAENQKGTPLTEEEVLSIRGRSVCMMLPRPKAIAMAEARGYEDIDPRYAWEQWQIARKRLRNRPENNPPSAL